MNKRGVRFMSILCIAFLTLFFTIDNAQVTKAASFTSKYTMNVNGENIGAKVYVKDGRTYIPLRTLTDALGYTISYSQLAELDIYHNYEIVGAAQNVSIWGNERWGYSIMQRIGEESNPDDVAIYNPALNCVSETDNCRVIKDIYEGPLVLNDTMYVPVRYLAEALELNLSISENNIINLTN